MSPGSPPDLVFFESTTRPTTPPPILNLIEIIDIPAAPLIPIAIPITVSTPLSTHWIESWLERGNHSDRRLNHLLRHLFSQPETDRQKLLSLVIDDTIFALDQIGWSKS